MDDTKNLHPNYIPALDGLRGVAIIMVILYHNFGYVDFFSFGWMGVDLFFVLSGYLITSILVSSKDSVHFLRNFYIRRILRIFPLYYLTLILFFFVFPLLKIRFSDAEYFIENQNWFWLFIQNFLFIGNLPEKQISLTHLWSLAIEEQYYLVWPFIILICKKEKTLLYILLTILTLLITVRSLLWFMEIKNFSYFNFYTFSRFDGICIGSILAICIRLSIFKLNWYKKFVPLFFVILNVFFLIIKNSTSSKIPYWATIGYLSLSIFFAMVIKQLVVSKSGITSKFLQNQILIFFGRISYGLYIFHWPIYIYCSPYFNDWPIFLQLPLAESIMKSLLLTLLAVIISFISFKFYEKPILRLKSKFISTH